MKRRSFHPKKRLGQHFLYDPAIAGKIVAAAGVGGDRLVVELGAGKGILTRPLAGLGARIIALEVDKPLFDELKAHFDAESGGEAATRVEVLHVDFTRISITGLLAARGFERCVLMGNLPYGLTRDVLFGILVDECDAIDSAYLMLQREVGERIVSPPGSRVYGITSVVLQSLFDVRILFRVAPGSFFPRPKVESAVLEFRRLESPLLKSDEIKAFVDCVKNVFQQRRKKIQNVVKSLYSLTETEVDEVQAATGLDLQKRPEELSKEEFLKLSRTLAEVSAVG